MMRSYLRYEAGSVGANGVTHDFTLFPLLNLPPPPLSKVRKNQFRGRHWGLTSVVNSLVRRITVA